MDVITLTTRILTMNKALCYDSLCYCLTVNHGFDTLHWTTHDDDTTFQAGSSFTFRSQLDGVLKERSVYVGKNDGVWTYFESGQALSEEDLSSYEVRRKRDHLNEGLLMELLFRLTGKAVQARSAFSTQLITGVTNPDCLCSPTNMEF